VYTGVIDQALQRAQQSLELAEKAGSPLAVVCGRKCMGDVHLLLGQPEAAIEPLERVYYDARDRCIMHGVFGQSVASLSRAYSGVGDFERARRTAEDGIEFSLRADAPHQEAQTSLALSEALRCIDIMEHRDRIAALLDRADDCVQSTKGFGLWPFVAEERARVAAALGDNESADVHLREAIELFTRFQAKGHAERLTTELSGRQSV
jgi:hypothetical protein